MRRTLILSCVIVGLLASVPSQAEVSFNPRDDYVFGVGSMAGGAMGVIGLTADFNWYSLVNGGVGLGSGIYFDSYMVQAKYLVMDRSFTPYMGTGLAYWKSTDTGENIARKSEVAVNLDMVKADGTELQSGILVIPVSLGIHYVSDVGLGIFAEVDYLMSLSGLSGTPYGAIGVQWYF
jgi:hypothetical protein